MHEVDEEAWDRQLDVNLRAVYLVAHHVVPVMLAQGGGAIVNNASVAALVGDRAAAAYCASKGGVGPAHQADGARLRRPRHPRQRHLLRRDRHAAVRARVVPDRHDTRLVPGTAQRVRTPSAASACPPRRPRRSRSWPATTRASSPACCCRSTAATRAVRRNCMRGLEGKVALVTGGSSGLGEAIVYRLAEEGVSVAVGGRDAERARGRRRAQAARALAPARPRSASTRSCWATSPSSPTATAWSPRRSIATAASTSSSTRPASGSRSRSSTPARRSGSGASAPASRAPTSCAGRRCGTWSRGAPASSSTWRATRASTASPARPSTRPPRPGS